MRPILPLFLLLAAAPLAHAATIYTDEAQFNTAIASLSGTTSTLDFENVTVNSTLTSGSTVEDVTFNYSFATGDQLMVTSESVSSQDTTSPDNFLGTDYAGNYNLIEDAEGFGMTFAAPVLAVGMYFITFDEIFAGDFQIITPEGTAANAGTPSILLDDGAYAYFVGIVGDSPFTTAEVSHCATCGGYFFFGVDDITTVTAIPEPETLTLLGLGLAGLVLARRRRRANLGV